MKSLFGLFLITVFLFGSVTTLGAASIYIDPPGGVVSPEQIFSVDLRLDIDDDCVNVVETHLLYPADQLQVTTVSRGQSILSLWVESPKIDQANGRVSFSGGVPGGYCGRIPGDPDLTNVLLTVVFQPLNGVISSEDLGLGFDEVRSAVFLNDGFGTEAEVEYRGAVYSVGPESTVDAAWWLEALRSDTTPPEAFDIDLLQEDSVFSGHFFIAFSTVDKGSGISHYLVKEEDIDNPGFERHSRRSAEFRPASSPYLLKDQTLNSIITVKAVDNAGNERLATFVPDESQRLDDRWLWFSNLISRPLAVGILVVIVVTIALSAFLYFLNRRRRQPDTDNGIY